GPKAQATRMVREYTTTLYQPAAVASRALAGLPVVDGTGPDAIAQGGGRLEYGPARELAAWQDRVRKAWQGLAIEHVEAAEGERRGRAGGGDPGRGDGGGGVGRGGGRGGAGRAGARRAGAGEPAGRPVGGPLRRRGRAGWPRAVRLHGPGAARAPAAGHSG